MPSRAARGPVALDSSPHAQAISAQLATAIAGRKPFTADKEAHSAVVGLFNGLAFSDDAIASVTCASPLSLH